MNLYKGFSHKQNDGRPGPRAHFVVCRDRCGFKGYRTGDNAEIRTKHVCPRCGAEVEETH